MSRKNTLSTLWVFTCYGDLAAARKALDAWADGPVQLVYQKERCPKTGRLHLQGVLRLSKSRSWDWVSETFYKKGQGWTFKIAWARKSWACNLHYCTKEATRVEGPYYVGIHEGFVKYLCRTYEGDLLRLSACGFKK